MPAAVNRSAIHGADGPTTTPDSTVDVKRPHRSPSTIVTAQRGNAPPRPPAAPAPRWPDGRINLGAPLGQNGLWERRNEHLVINPKSYQADATKTARVHIDQVPLQPWARELTNYRHALSLASEPYTRCKPAGGPRQFMSPYGLEIVEMD